MTINPSTKRSRFSRRAKTSPATEQLVDLATRLAQSTCRLEDQFWESRLAERIAQLLRGEDEAAITAALDQLYAVETRAYDGLIDLIEAEAEATRVDSGQAMDLVLIAIPVLAWSRYPIPSARIAAPHLADLRVQIQAHLLAADARLGLADYFFSPDQLPQSYVESAQLLQKLVSPALHGRDLKVDADRLPETVNFLSDIRYLIGAVAVPRDAALFRWQEGDTTRESAFAQWREQANEVVRRLLPACATELVPPGAFHAAVREADRASRPYSLHAAVAFLQTVLGVQASDLRAVIGAYYDQHLEEYRVGLSLNDSGDVVHGIVWPILDNEDEGSETVAQIETVLREAGVGNVRVLDHRLPLEFCDDCGAPLYPNADGEPTHAELPEDSESGLPPHLH